MNSVKFEHLLEQLMVSNIDFTDYRKKRTCLIQQITVSAVPPSFNTAAQAESNHIEPALHTPARNQENSRLALPLKQMIFVILLIISGALSWYLSNTQVEKIPHQLVVDNTIEKKIVVDELVIDEPFIAAFNQKTSWDTESVSNFLVQWQSLSHDQQTTARKSDSFIRLSKLLKQRIQALRNHREGKTKPTSRQENLYIWLSSQLSISIN